MAATITAEHRDALFAQVRHAFYAFEDLNRGIESGDHELAFKVGRRISDGLRLILDGGLGFAPRTVEPLTLRMPDDELGPIMIRLKAETAALYDCRRREFEEYRREEAEVTSTRDACTSVLSQL